MQAQQNIFYTQAELENSISHSSILKNIDTHNYFSSILKKYYIDLKEKIEKEKKSIKPVKLLLKTNISFDDISSMTICFVLSECLKESDSNELLYNVLSHDIGNLIEPLLDKASKLQIGSLLLGNLIDLGFVETKHKYHKKKTLILISLSDVVKNIIHNIDNRLLTFTTFAIPCIESPHEWQSLTGGGFHTTDFKKRFGCFIKPPFSFGSEKEFTKKLLKADFKNVYSAINSLQNTKWKVNKKVLEIVKNVSKIVKTDEIFAENIKKSKPKAHEKIELYNWYKENKQNTTKYLKYHSLIKCAETFSEYPEIYFVYKCDFRGRVYAISRDLNPQSSDLSKGLLKFAIGKPLLDKDAIKWFKINGANRWGYDKVSFSDRVKWVDDHSEKIYQIANDPIKNLDWLNADKPVQFLAWALEYKNCLDCPDRFLSYLPVALDGTANGLQHLTALLKDHTASKIVNLEKTDYPSDLYSHISVKVNQYVKADNHSENEIYKNLWLNEGITRKVVKRSTMTTPYGVSRFSMSDFILEDYLKNNTSTKIPCHLQTKSANYLSGFVHDVIKESIPAANSIMVWLKNTVKTALENGNDCISWVAPSGFFVVQNYKKQKKKRVRINRFGNLLSIYETLNDIPDKNRHIKGISPNFIHSLDASHMIFVINSAKQYGIDSFSMIHDDFGTHPSDTELFHQIIKEQFFNLYNDFNPLLDFYKHYPFLKIPDSGKYDIHSVLESDYLFS